MSDVEAKVEKLSVEETTPEQPEVSQTVLDSTDFTVVHPLTHKWTFWYLKPATGNVENWSELLKKLVNVGTVEEFWGAYNSIPKITEVPVKADFAFFREGISPEWEDPTNASGGKWIAQLHINDEIDSKWLNVLLSLIGGTLDSPEGEDVINGVFVMVRPRGVARIQMWVNSDAQKSLEAAKKLKNALNLNEKQRIEFQAHNEPKQKNGLQFKIEL